MMTIMKARTNEAKVNLTSSTFKVNFKGKYISP